MRQLLLLIPLAFLVGCGSTSTPSVDTGKPKVVATFSVLGDFVTQIARDKVNLVVL